MASFLGRGVRWGAITLEIKIKDLHFPSGWEYYKLYHSYRVLSHRSKPNLKITEN